MTYVLFVAGGFCCGVWAERRLGVADALHGFLNPPDPLADLKAETLDTLRQAREFFARTSPAISSASSAPPAPAQEVPK